MHIRTVATCCFLMALAGCAQLPPAGPPDQATHDTPESSGEHPPAAALPPSTAGQPPPAPPSPGYSLSVNRISVEQLLIAIARDADLDLDVHPGVTGVVTLNAIDEPLPRLLDRITRQTGLRFELDGHRLAVMPDTPVLRSYRIDYVNLSRAMKGEVATSTQISTSSSALGDARHNDGGNASLTKIETLSANRFWETLETNIRTLLKEHERFIQRRHCDDMRRSAESADAQATPSCEDAVEADFIVSNRETGTLMIRATSAQHTRIAEFLDLVQAAAHRQVTIEATIVEITLADGYKQGIDWNRLNSPNASLRPRGADTDASALSPTITYLSSLLDIKLDLLESFGTVKVLSSPRLSVLNNQTAMLKVVEEVVYFLVDASTTTYDDSSREKITATTTPQSVSVGMVMALTPQIGADGHITLNVRPTISSISSFRDDPNPSLGAIPNRVPQIRTREIESVLRLADGEVAILGGLMEDKIDYDTGRIPLFGAIPVLGELFTRRDNSVRRTELAIFLRPRIVARDAPPHPVARHRHALPTGDTFHLDSAPGTRNFPGRLIIREAR